MPNLDGTKTDEERREFWAVQLAREALVQVPPVTPEWVAELRASHIKDDEDQDFVANLVRAVKDKHAFLEDKRKSITKPLNDATRATNALFKPALGALEEVEQVLKGKIAEYMQRKQIANTQALQLAAAAATPEQAVRAIDSTSPVAPPAGVSVRYVWKFEVDAPELVPRELCSPDPKKIEAALAIGVQVPGVRVFQEPIVSSRR